MYSSRTIFQLLFVVFFAIPAFSQVDMEKVDSLNKVLKKAKEIDKAAIFVELAREFKYDEPDKAVEYANKAIELAVKFKDKNHEAAAYFNRGVSFAEKQEYKKAKMDYEKTLSIARGLKEKEILTDALSALGSLYDDMGVRDTAIIYLEEALKLSKEINYRQGLLKSYNNLGVIYYNLSDFDKAIEYFTESYNISVEDKDTLRITINLNLLGICYYYASRNTNAIRYYMEALRINEAIGNQRAVGRNSLNLANIYRETHQFADALRYYNRTLKLGKELNDSSFIGASYINIGIVYKVSTELKIDSVRKLTIPDEKKLLLENDLKEGYYTAMRYYDSALTIYINKVDENLASTYSNIGFLLHRLNRFDESNDQFEKARRIALKYNSQKILSEVLSGIAANYSEMKDYTTALAHYNQSLQIAKKISLGEVIRECYRGIYKIYEYQNDYKNAFRYFQLYVDKKDEIAGEEMSKFIKDQNDKYETDKKEQALKLAETEQDRLKATNRMQKFVIYGAAFFAILLIAFIVFVVAQLRLIQKKNALLAQRNAQIQAQKEEIQAQRDLVMKQKEEITDSIHYAQRIQKAVLPSDEFANKVLPDNFILFRPRDIVSGDFYWITHKNNKVIAVAADCTGHGVPGAFMSMLGVSFLNEIVNKLENPEAHIILNELRHHVKTTLDQTGKKDEAKDGMDIALAIFDFENMKVQYAGAYNPLFICRIGEPEIIEIKADKMPIGIYIKEKESFTPNDIDLKKGDVLYIFSDGYVSQFGGADGRKFMTKNFKELLMQIYTKPMAEQRAILDKALDDWRGDMAQVDDILVIGVRV